MRSVLLGVVSLGVACVWIGGAPTRWTVLVLGVACGAAAPGALAEAAGLRMWVAAVCAGVGGAVGVTAGIAQVEYLYGVSSGASLTSGAEGVLRGVAAAWRHDAEFQGALVTVALPFAALTATRQWGLRLPGQIACTWLLAGSASSVVYRWLGFVGLPQPTWLLGAPWFQPEAGFLVIAYPALLGWALPLVAWASGPTLQRPTGLPKLSLQESASVPSGNA